jgi:hypothetical protein
LPTVGLARLWHQHHLSMVRHHNNPEASLVLWVYSFSSCLVGCWWRSDENEAEICSSALRDGLDSLVANGRSLSFDPNSIGSLNADAPASIFLWPPSEFQPRPGLCESPKHQMVEMQRSEIETLHHDVLNSPEASHVNSWPLWIWLSRDISLQLSRGSRYFDYS